MASKVERTTITVNKRILDAAREKSKENEETLSDFLSRALLNQLEKEECYSNIRYEVNSENGNF